MLQLQADRLVYAQEELTKVSADVRRVGEGVAAQGSFGWHGARFRVDAALRPDGSRTAVDLQLGGETDDAGRLLEAMGNDDLLTGGSMDLDLLLHGSGSDSRDLLASSRGRLVVQVDQGTLASTRLNQLGGDLLDHLVKLVYPQDATTGRDLHCAVLAVDFADGQATTDRGIALQTRQANLVGSAEIGLADESIDVAVHPYSRGGLGLSMGMVAKLMRFEGTLAEPHVVFDQEVVGKAAASAVAAVATSGITLVAQGMFQRMQQDPDPCGTARQLYVGGLPEVRAPEGHGDTGLERMEVAGTSIEVPELAREPVQDILDALPERGDSGMSGSLGTAVRHVKRFRDAAGKGRDDPKSVTQRPWRPCASGQWVASP
ncbi:MAG: AsmA-like C-terminal region-containing protein [Proteobacteria bacterium]|nr:AsmA-like C-terminal region-containing protein [Pseudomonadota bacterium]